jgi:hypothetical protein
VKRPRDQFVSLERLVGRPSVAHNDFKVRALKVPTQEFASTLVARDRRRRIPGSALGVANFEVNTGNSLHGLGNLPIGVTDTRTEIEDEFRMNIESRYCQHVGCGEVAHVDVVTNIRSVGCRIVVAVDVQMAAMTSGNVQRNGYEVNLWAMAFGVRNRSTRSIEVTQHRGTQAPAHHEPVESFLHHSLGLSVGTMGLNRSTFVNGHLDLISVHRAGRRKDESLHPGLHERVE